MKVQDIELRLLCRNEGQVDGLPKNPRFIRDEKFELLKKSIQENPEMLGLRELLVYPVGDRYVIIGGNMRYEACKALGYQSVPCKVLDADTPVETLKAYTIKDNAGFGEWDWDAIANEWDTEEVTDWGLDVPDWETDEEPQQEAKEDDFDETKDEIPAKVTAGDIWQLGDHRLMCGDSTKTEDVQRLMQGETADLWLTDPPYNVDYSQARKDVEEALGGGSIHKDIANDTLSTSDFLKFCKDAFAASVQSLKAGGAFYVWTTQGHPMIQVSDALDSVGLRFRQQLIWMKQNFVLGRMDYKGQHEPCFYGWKEGASHFFVNLHNESTVIPDEGEINIDKMTKTELRDLLHKIYENPQPTTVIRENRPTKSEDHPTMKPVKLFGRLIRNSSRKGEIVLDTFGGSGTTIVACEQLGRKARLMELDPHYCDVIISRWEKLTGQKATKL